jgi:hypothetical protein
MMEVANGVIKVMPNRAMEIANLYHSNPWL